MKMAKEQERESKAATKKKKKQSAISGVGEFKYDKYGEQFLKELKQE